MAIHLLIDTCNLRRLASTKEFSSLLQQLEYLVKGKYITLLAPDILKMEWAKHKESQKEQILKSISDLEKEARQKRLLKDESVEFLEERIEEARGLLLSQLEIIDSLLLEHATPISVQDETILLMDRQRRSQKAPFTNPKKNNLNDAELLFSSLDFLEKAKEERLYFVSDNHTEFGHSQDNSIVIHPDIAEVFPTIDIYYTTHIEDIYKTFDQLGLPRYSKKKEGGRRKIKNVISIDRKKPVLDQLHEYLEKRFRELPVLPKKLFTEHYPFILGDTFNYWHKPFTLITDNKDLYELLTEVKVEAGAVIDKTGKFIKNEVDEKKIKEIFKCLFFNYLHYIALEKGDEMPLPYQEAESTCSCSLCLYRRLDFPALLEKRATDGDDLATETVQARLKIAYGHYKIGNFIAAAKLLERLMEEQQEGKGLLNYIICFNLQHLGHFITHYYWDNPEIKSWGQRLIEIDLDAVFKECRTTSTKDVLEWIHEKKFYDETLAATNEKLNGIRDLYYSQSSGFNESTREVLESYLSADAFLQHNSIIYDIYSQYDTLTASFTEASLAAHGWSPSMGGRLNQFNDALLEKLLLAGKADIIQKFFNRFKHSVLHYQPTAQQGSTFIDRVEHLLDSYPATVRSYATQKELPNHYFWEQYSEIVYNALTLVSLLDLDENTVNRLAKKNLIFLQQEKHLHYYQLHKYVRGFLRRKYKLITPTTLQAYFRLILQQTSFHDDDTNFELINSIFTQRGLLLDFSEEEFDWVRVHFIKESEDASKKPSWYALGFIYEVLLREEQKAEIRNYVFQSLSTDFDPERYYIAAMDGMTINHAPFTDAYIEAVSELVAKGPQPRAFSRTEFYTDRRIDHFLNFCFKYDLAIPKSIKGGLTGLGDYYAWLLHMEEFDYSRFNPEWLHHHFTLYYKKKFRQSIALKRHLLHILKEDKHSDSKDLFLTVYCFDDE